MLNEYSISDILPEKKDHLSYFIGTFESVEDPNVEWPHRHSYYSIVWFTHGTGINVIDFSEYEILENRIFMVSPKQVHNWTYSEDCQGYILTFENYLAADLGIDFVVPFVDLNGSHKDLLNQVFENLISEYNTIDKLSVINIKTGIQYLCAIINRISSSQNYVQHGINLILTRFKNIISKDFQSAPTIGECADLMKISREDLNQLCQTYTGVSAEQYVLNLKITESKRLLMYNSLNVSEIALKIGFDDPSYFSRIFKKKTDLSPGEFREKYLK